MIRQKYQKETVFTNGAADFYFWGSWRDWIAAA
jgi:hypothetical protein